MRRYMALDSSPDRLRLAEEYETVERALHTSRLGTHVHTHLSLQLPASVPRVCACTSNVLLARLSVAAAAAAAIGAERRRWVRR